MCIRDSVCYDRQGGSAASRLIWTLHTFGFYNCSLLDGGLDAWIAEGFEVTQGPPETPQNETPVVDLSTARQHVVNTDEVLKILGKTGTPTNDDNRTPVFLDARSQKEFNGEDVRSDKGGRIPGARQLEWTDALDRNNHMKLLPENELRGLVERAGFKTEDTIVAYCQTHQRSSLSYVMLRHLGFANVFGLEGAWSEWGNRDDTPIEK